MADVAAVGLVMVVLAFLVRIGVHLGRAPGGVDTWYFLAYADAVRRKPALTVRLPQYLLQDEWQSYPPLFPTLLALVPGAWLRRWYWAVSPALDCVHLALLYVLTYKITRSLGASAVAAAVYAFTPHLVSETRSLNARSFSSLMHTVAVVLTLRYVVLGESGTRLALALAAGTALYLASATGAAAYGFVCAVLSVAFHDPRYVLVALASLVLAAAVSGGHLFRVMRSYVEALQFWRRNRQNFGAHAIHHSPVYGTPRPAGSGGREPGFLGGSTPALLLRLVGENPFILALPLSPSGIPPWGTRIQAWAIALTLLTVLATLVPALRAFGPGRSYLKAAVFPTAYTLGVSIGGTAGLQRPIGMATLAGLLLSLVAIGFFYSVMRRRRTESTSEVPPGLAEAARHLAGLPGDGVLCLPTMYADYVCYHSGKAVLWGGHCGDLRPLEAVSPVITREIPEMLAAYRVTYILLDRLYTDPSELRLEGAMTPLARFASFELYEVRPKAR